MAELGKLFFPFFSTPENYEQSLQKMASILWYELVLIQIVLYQNTHLGSDIDSVAAVLALDELNSLIGIEGSKNVTRLVFASIVAILVAVVSHMVQLHDRISDILRIRHRFDKLHILYPLALLAGSTMTWNRLNAIDDNRRSLMHKVFYRFASSRSDDPLVDKHDIQHAIGAWCWYWVLIEGQIFIASAALLSMSLGEHWLANLFFVVIFIYFILSCIQYRRLEQLSRPQIERIASDQEADKLIRSVFDAL